jgi:hypothetical protein
LRKADTMSDSAGKKPTKPKYDGTDESTAAAESVEDTNRVDEQPTDTADESAQGTAADRLKETMHQTADTVQAKASEAKQRAQAATAHAAAKAENLSADAIAKLPPPTREKVERVADTARRRPVPVAAAATAAAAGLLVIRRILRAIRKK